MNRQTIDHSERSSLGRDHWAKELDFVLSVIGFAVDLANFWRFPYLVYINGGGAFLVPYFLMLMFGALPLLYLEFLLGQIQQESCISIWNLCPFFKGLGISQIAMILYVMSYYSIIMGYSLYYLFAVISGGLPWMGCSSFDSTPFCLNATQMHERNRLMANYTKSNMTWPPDNVSTIAQLSSQEYFERNILVIQESVGLSDIGSPRWQLFYCCGMIFIVLIFCVWKGIKSSGKVVYVTVGLSYILIAAFLINGCLLEGSLRGITYFLFPDFTKLKSSQVWLDAAVQVIMSLGLGFGVHITFASYNKPSYNCFRSCLFTVFVSAFSSLMAGITVFSYLGYMSWLTGEAVEEVANHGPGLVFQVYPMAVGSLPLAKLWSFVLFLLLITLGLDTCMSAFMSAITGIREEIPIFFFKHQLLTRESFTVVVLTGCYLCSIIHMTRGGILVLYLFDRSARIPLLLICLGQLIAAAWGFGLPQLCEDIQTICGYVPHIAWRICWKIASPVFIIIVVIYSFVNAPPLSYRFGAYHPELASKLNLNNSLTYEFPGWSAVLMSFLSLLLILPIPAVMVSAMMRYPSFFHAISPTWEQGDIKRGAPLKRKSVRYCLSLGPVEDNLKANGKRIASKILKRLKRLTPKWIKETAWFSNPSTRSDSWSKATSSLFETQRRIFRLFKG